MHTIVFDFRHHFLDAYIPSRSDRGPCFTISMRDFNIVKRRPFECFILSGSIPGCGLWDVGCGLAVGWGCGLGLVYLYIVVLIHTYVCKLMDVNLQTLRKLIIGASLVSLRLVSGN